MNSWGGRPAGEVGRASRPLARIVQRLRELTDMGILWGRRSLEGE